MSFNSQYFTKFKRTPENRGAGVRPLPYFRASTSYFVIYCFLLNSVFVLPGQ
jgi:hypothetical protein